MNTRTKKFIPVILFVVCVFLFGSTANAHGFGERYDLPIPLTYFLIGAALTVAFSFVAIGWFIRSSGSDLKYPRINVYRYFAMAFFCKAISRCLGQFLANFYHISADVCPFWLVFGSCRTLENSCC